MEGSEGALLERGTCVGRDEESVAGTKDVKLPSVRGAKGEGGGLLMRRGENST